MKIISSPAEMTAFAESARANGGKIALVPTMGALHEGHLSLVRKAKTLADTVVVSIFVNPTQFGPNEDFDKYPRQLEADMACCGAAGANVVFAPAVSDIYLPDASTYVVEEEISRHLCGRTRPKHFRGVTTVVSILFNIVRPDIAVFGEKDAQQVSIIRRMVRDLFMGVEIATGEIVRDENGLALSSRNKYLDKLERLGASRLHAALEDGRKLCLEGCSNVDRVKAHVINRVANAKTRVIYVEIVDAETSLPMSEAVPGKSRISAAVWYGQTRLIDNVRI